MRSVVALGKSGLVSQGRVRTALAKAPTLCCDSLNHYHHPIWGQGDYVCSTLKGTRLPGPMSGHVIIMDSLLCCGQGRSSDRDHSCHSM